MKEKMLAIWMCLFVAEVVLAGGSCCSAIQQDKPAAAVSELDRLLDNIEQSGSKLQSFQADIDRKSVV